MTFLNLLFIFIALCLLSLAISSKSLAPWVPTWKKDLPRIFKLAALKPNQIFYDLGCGNGKTVIYANKKCGAKAIGLEMALPLFCICKIRQIFNYNQKLIFKFKNLFKEDLSNADVVYVFGLPESLQNKLRLKLEHELKSGAKIISYVFPITGWEPKIVSKPEPKDLAIYLYEKS